MSIPVSNELCELLKSVIFTFLDPFDKTLEKSVIFKI